MHSNICWFSYYFLVLRFSRRQLFDELKKMTLMPIYAIIFFTKPENIRMS